MGPFVCRFGMPQTIPQTRRIPKRLWRVVRNVKQKGTHILERPRYIYNVRQSFRTKLHSTSAKYCCRPNG